MTVQELGRGRHRAVVVVTHNACIQLLLCELLGLPDTAFRRLPCGFLHAAAIGGDRGPGGAVRLRVRALGLAPREWTAWLHRWGRGPGTRGEEAPLPGRGPPLRHETLPAAEWAPPPGCAPRVRAWRAVLAASGTGAGPDSSGHATLQTVLARAVGQRAGWELVDHVLHPTPTAGRPAGVRALLALPASPFVHPLHRGRRRRDPAPDAEGDAADCEQGWLLCALVPAGGTGAGRYMGASRWP